MKLIPAEVSIGKFKVHVGLCNFFLRPFAAVKEGTRGRLLPPSKKAMEWSAHLPRKTCPPSGTGRTSRFLPEAKDRTSQLGARALPSLMQGPATGQDSATSQLLALLGVIREMLQATKCHCRLNSNNQQPMKVRSERNLQKMKCFMGFMTKGIIYLRNPTKKNIAPMKFPCNIQYRLQDVFKHLHILKINWSSSPLKIVFELLSFKQAVPPSRET